MQIVYISWVVFFVLSLTLYSDNEKTQGLLKNFKRFLMFLVMYITWAFGNIWLVVVPFLIIPVIGGLIYNTRLLAGLNSKKKNKNDKRVSKYNK